MSRRLPRLATTCLILVIAVALYVRLEAVNTFVSAHPATADRLVGDEAAYDHLGTRIAAGEPLDRPTFMPLYPAFLASAYWLLGRNLNSPLWIQAFLGAATVLLLFSHARKHHGIGVALIASAIVALHPDLVAATTRLQPENLYVPLLLVSVTALFSLMAHPKRGTAVLFGLSVAAMVYCRPDALLLPAVLLLFGALSGWGLRRTTRVTALALVTLAVVLAPWTLHNWQTYGVAHPLVDNGAEIRANEPTTGAQGDERVDVLTQRALGSIVAEPLTYGRRSAMKIFFYWAGDPSADWASLQDRSVWEAIKAALVFLLVPICLVAAWLLRRRLFSDFLPYVVIVLYFTVAQGLLWTAASLSLPLHPLLVIVLASAMVGRSSSGRESYHQLARRRARLIIPGPSAGRRTRTNSGTTGWPKNGVMDRAFGEQSRRGRARNIIP